MAELDKYIGDYGMTSFKFFMSFRGEEGAYIGLPGIDDGVMYELFEALGQRPGAVLCVHTENIEVVWSIRKRLQESGRDDLKAWHESRPPFTESEAAVRAMLFAAETGCSVYIVHTSTQDTLAEVRSFREQGGQVYIETCPHYLTHTYDSPVGMLGKQNPPLRGWEDVEAMWEAIEDGTVDTIGSDHAPRTGERKRGSVWTASPGQPNMPLILPVLLSEGAHKRGLSLERVAQVTAANAARIFGLWPRKGSLQIGADADLVVVDMGLEKTVTAAGLQGRADYSIYEGVSLTGWPVLTMLRGQTVARDGQLLAKPGQGKFIHRTLGG
jgi:dihydropyrimidinase